jgi:two-component system cell cycle sensor histidine kinase/response regulator CckA
MSILTTLFDASDVGLAIYDRELRFVMVNALLARLNGVPQSEHIGRTIREVLPRLANAIEPILQHVLATGELRTAEIETDAPDHQGDTRSWFASFWALREGDEIVGVGVRVADQTARVAAERALRKSEAQFRAICDTSPIGIFLADPSGSTLYTNPANARQMGISPEQARGHGWEKSIHPDDLPKVREGFFAATKDGRGYSGFQRYVQPNGHVVMAYVTATAVRESGEVIGYVGIAEDVSERMLREAALRESELRFRQLAENIQSVFWLAAADRSAIYYVSPAFAQIWGLPAEVIIADPRRWLETVHPEDRQRTLAIVSAPTNAPVEHEYRVIRPDGSIVWISDRYFPVRDESGATVRLAGIASDVTHQKTLEAQVLQAQKLDSIGRLAGGIAHDFNNMLTVIVNQAIMAQRTCDAGSPPREELAHISEAATQATEVTRQLLAFARRQAFVPSLLDPNDFIRAVSAFLGRLIGEQLELVVELAPDVGIMRGDRAQLEQVLVNLALNARDAMPDGGALTVRTANAQIESTSDAVPVPAGAWVIISVEDKGCGISEAVRSHIFEPFFSTKPHGEGTGLGLSVCYGIIKQHGGHVVVASALGEGTTFSLYFPRVDGTAVDTTSSTPPAQTQTMPGGTETILVVEDDAQVRRIAVATLSAHGYTVLAATDGVDALRVLEAKSDAIDLVLSDIVMPNMDGAELGAIVRKRYPRLAVLYTSGYPSDSELVGPDGRAQKFVAKPYVPATLLNGVRNALDHKR